jgi:tripartite-type tricarboxylate transporter receptor subunit TctC
MASSAVRERMLAIGFEPVVSSPDDFAARIKSEIPRWGKIIREANIKPE